MTGVYAPLNRLIIGGHRGAGCTDKPFYQHRASHVPPENTLESIKHAFTLGADYVEVDVATSQDGVPICVHNVIPQDHFFGSTTPNKALNKLDYDEIQHYPAGRSGQGQIASLANVIELITKIAPDNPSWNVNLELKGVQGSSQPWEGETFLQSVASVIARGPLRPERILWSSFALKNIILMSHLMPRSKFGFLFSEGRSSEIYSDHTDDICFRHLPFNLKWASKIISIWTDEAHPSSHLGYLHPEIKSISNEMLLFAKERGLGINSWPHRENLNAERLKIYENLIERCRKLDIPLTIITDEIATLRSL